MADAPVNVTDRQTLETWLEGLPHRARVAFTARAALRVLPMGMDVLFQKKPKLERSAFAISCFRTTLISIVACKCTTPAMISRIKASASSAVSASHSVAPSTGNAFDFSNESNAHTAALEAAKSVLSEHQSSVNSSAHSVHLSTLLPDLKAVFLQSEALSQDITVISADHSEMGTFFARPLWPDRIFPKNISGKWATFKAEAGPEWAFWTEWYQSMLDGTPLDWELQRRVALIPDAVWEEGVEAVAERIGEIRARRALEQRIADLERERDKAAIEDARLQIGGNNPPEAIDDPESIRTEVSIIWATIDDLRTEAAKDVPNKENVEQSVSKLSSALSATTGWCAKKGDLVVDTLIKWGVPVGAATLVANSELVKAVIDAAKAWLRFL